MPKSTCDNCGGTGAMGTYYEAAPYVGMAVPIVNGAPNMSGLANEQVVTVIWSSGLAFCNEGCSDAWFETRANEVLIGRRWDEV
jgi:hypothetical protein